MSEDSDDEVTQWLSGLARGDERAVEEIWHQYFNRLVRLARSKLAEGKRREADEEDVALSAFNEFFRGASEGRFPRLDDRFPNHQYRRCRSLHRRRLRHPSAPLLPRPSRHHRVIGGQELIINGSM